MGVLWVYVCDTCHKDTGVPKDEIPKDEMPKDEMPKTGRKGGGKGERKKDAAENRWEKGENRGKRGKEKKKQAATYNQPIIEGST